MTLSQQAEKPTRVVTNEDIKKYERLVMKFLTQNVAKNWNEANVNSKDDVTLGNTGMSIHDIKQHLFTELVVALQKYNPNYKSKPRYEKDKQGNFVLDDNGEKIMIDPGGRSVKEITFVTTHLYNRCGQLMIKLTTKKTGYGMWASDLSSIFEEKRRDYD